MQAAGELLRGVQLDNFVKKGAGRKKKPRMDGAFKKRVSDQMDSDSDSSSHSVEVLSAADKMANAITDQTSGRHAGNCPSHHPYTCAL